MAKQKKNKKDEELVEAIQHTSSFSWRQLRILFLFCCFTLIFLSYPGDSYYFHIFAYRRDLFSQAYDFRVQYISRPVPYVASQVLQPEITAQGLYIIDLDTATPIIEKNVHTRFLPASTTKIITALTAYDYFRLDDVLEVKRVQKEGQVMGLVQNEKITFENLLYGLLIHSGNDAAYVIADNYRGGYGEFIKAMNIKAVELKMKNTRFSNPAGLDESSQYTTPFDLSLAARQLLENKTLSKIVSTKSITVSDTEFTHFHPLYNVNRLLGEIPGIAGLKTGKTDLAGEHLVTLYELRKRPVLIVLLKSEDRFTDTETIVNWLQTNVRYEPL